MPSLHCRCAGDELTMCVQDYCDALPQGPLLDDVPPSCERMSAARVAFLILVSGMDSAFLRVKILYLPSVP